MLTNVSSIDYQITGDSVQEKDNVQEIGKKAAVKNIYAKPAEFSDSLEISEKAKELFQKEKDVEKFTAMVMNTPLTGEESAKIQQLIREMIQEGEFIDNGELAKALQSDYDLMSYLFS